MGLCVETERREGEAARRMTANRQKVGERNLEHMRQYEQMFT